MAGHAQLKFVMTECSKTQIRLTGLICFLQETHSKPEFKNLWTHECKHHIFYSGRSSTGGGVCILVNKTLPFKLIYHKEILPRKIQSMKLKTSMIMGSS